MTVCHARYCDERAELRLFVGNDHSYRNSWAGGLNYCQHHAEKVGLSMVDRGLRVLIEQLSDTAPNDGPTEADRTTLGPERT